MKRRLAVIASGRGTNFQAILEGIEQGIIDAECVALITDNPRAGAIERAERAKIPVMIIDYSRFASREKYEALLHATMETLGVDLFVLAGYMRIVGREIIRSFEKRVINIHPSLLPSFSGLNAQRQALQYGVKISGCTVHFVDEALDGGPIILQRSVSVDENDTEESLSARILVEEHRCLIEAVRLFCDGKLSVTGRMVIIQK